MDKNNKGSAGNGVTWSICFSQAITTNAWERNTQLMENAQELPKIKIRQCLVPRKEIVGIESKATVEELTKKFMETKLSKLLVLWKQYWSYHWLCTPVRYVLETGNHPICLTPHTSRTRKHETTDLIGKFNRGGRALLGWWTNLAVRPGSSRWKMCWRNYSVRYMMNMTRKSSPGKTAGRKWI